ncbi:MAG: hypothetical protein JSS02_17360 [Planctomycetes bacterium]|nr:hypothetical protein [Planctomycetota bacterium]
MGAFEFGFRLGRRARPKTDDTVRSQLGVLEASVLGILALLLGFAFSMAASRFDARRQQIIDEANAIGTTYLRTSLLNEPHQTAAAELLRQYVDARIEFYDAGVDHERFLKSCQLAEQLHGKLWDIATKAGKEEPRAVTTGLFIQSLNDVIDFHSKRVTAQYNRVPLAIFLLLYFVAVMAMGLAGYTTGTGGRRLPFPTVTAALLISAVILLIIDLHRPREGVIRLGQQSMLDLRESLLRQAR